MRISDTLAPDNPLHQFWPVPQRGQIGPAPAASGPRAVALSLNPGVSIAHWHRDWRGFGKAHVLDLRRYAIPQDAELSDLCSLGNVRVLALPFHVSDAQLEQIHGLGNLYKLCLKNCAVLSANAIGRLAALPALEWVRLPDGMRGAEIDEVRQGIYLSEPDPSGFRCCYGFKAPRDVGASVSVSLEGAVTPGQIKSLPALSGISSLDLSQASGIGATHLDAAARLPGLRSLVLPANCTDEDLVALLATTSLQILDLTRCSMITDAGMQALRARSGLCVIPPIQPDTSCGG